jgi:peptide/histidine transporter 3/4
MIGVADVFALVGMQEFFYDHMPGEMRSMGLALYLSITCIGGFISSALISFIDRVTSSGGGDSWFADNLNRAHLDYFYWLLAGISAAELVLYLWLTQSDFSSGAVTYRSCFHRSFLARDSCGCFCFLFLPKPYATVM